MEHLRSNVMTSEIMEKKGRNRLTFLEMHVRFVGIPAEFLAPWFVFYVMSVLKRRAESVFICSFLDPEPRQAC